MCAPNCVHVAARQEPEVARKEAKSQAMQFAFAQGLTAATSVVQKRET